ncbi:MAG: heme exporter protein CcmB [Caulobacteraceae bacterium]|nr:heme exporter protein CcmB [Caulobacter sp.]
MRALAALFRRELAAAWGRGGGPLFAGAFFLGVATLFPLAAGAEPGRLRPVATGAAFAALALASLLSLERLFARDWEDGALDLLALGAVPLELVALVKCAAQWLAAGLPLALLAPGVAVMLGASPALAPVLWLAAAAAGLAYAFTGGVGAALSLGARRAHLLTAVVVLPLYAPPTIFGAGAVSAAAAGLPWGPPLALACAYATAAAALSPFAMAAACRAALE